ncbi:hypothetical protein FRC12_003131 [Ceratobasidium sp. 428]|nr:hypothetical protein FRC12_003131 [Ceratobasidium sp. 428]
MSLLLGPSGRRRIQQNTLDSPPAFNKTPDESESGDDEYKSMHGDEHPTPTSPTRRKGSKVHFHETNGEEKLNGGTHRPPAKRRTRVEPGTKKSTSQATVDMTKSQDTILREFKSKSKLQDYAPVWRQYVKLADEEDKDLVEDWDRIIDVTLVFAALFSAVITGFVLESAKGLQVDQSQAAVSAVRDLAGTIRNAFNISPETRPYQAQVTQVEDTFSPTTASIWVNCLWFFSLGLSISVSLFAMLAKRWCYNFRSQRFGTAFQRSMKRQKSWDNIEQWKMELIMEQLPTLMHVALIIYLSEIHKITTIVVSALVGVTLVAYWALTIITVWSQDCPLVTPFTRITWALIKPLLAIYNSTRTAVAHIHSKTILWTTPGLAETWQLILGSPKKKYLLTNLYRRWRNMDIKKLVSATWVWAYTVVLKSSQKVVRRFRNLIARLRRKEGTDVSLNWIMQDRPSQSTNGRVIVRPVKDNIHPDAFRALVWILRHSKDKDVITEVLEHLASFPEVMLESGAGSDILHTATFQVLQCLTLFQNDPNGWREVDQFGQLCGQLEYLATRPWLHSPLEKTGYRNRLLELSYSQATSPIMSTDDFKDQIKSIKETPFDSSKKSIIWLETLAGKVVLSCHPEQTLQICMGLCNKILASRFTPEYEERSAETRLTLWWILLNCAVDCSGFGAWPSSDARRYSYSSLERDDGAIAVKSDSLLTLAHLRDSRERQKQSCWLTITGISGILYAFSRYSDHDHGPAREINREQFETIINILHAALYTPASSWPHWLPGEDQFLGTLPVYHETEVRLYEFDSLDYCVDAITAAAESNCFETFSGRLASLAANARELKRIKQAQFTRKQNDSNIFKSVIQQYQNTLHENRNAELWMTSRLFEDPNVINDLSKVTGGLRFFSRLVSDLIFGFPSKPSGEKTPENNIPTKVLDIITPKPISWEEILWWAWAPIYDGDGLSRIKEDATKPGIYQHLRAGALWKAIRDIGLLDIPYNPNPYLNFMNYALLFVKAGLLERLYSLPPSGSNLPNQLDWSLTLSRQVYRLLQCWDSHGEMLVDDQIFIITPIGKLLDVLYNDHRRTQQDSHQITAVPKVAANSTDTLGKTSPPAYIQLSLLIGSGALQKLSLPFTGTFRVAALNSPDIGDEGEWRDSLVRTINNVARSHPRLAASHGRIPYSDLIIYYESQQDSDRRTQMLNLVNTLEKDLTISGEA